ncbi:MAG: SDR family NAD(P)-dependent oxidoreductase [Cellvibrionaceae bacterium]
MNYQDQVVMITGASGGLGQEAAKQFAQAGAKLALSDINEALLIEVAAQLRASGVEVFHQVCDVTNEAAVEQFVAGTLEAFGRLDVAINNAGLDPEATPLIDMSSEAFERMMSINVRGVFLGMKHQIPAMLKHKSGRILNISSIAGVTGHAYGSIYAATKHAVIGMTKSAAVEYGRQNIRVNAVCPGVTETNMFDRAMDALPDRERAIKGVGDSTCLKRHGQPEEVVRGMLFACDPQNTYMTGHALMMDGGFSAI